MIHVVNGGLDVCLMDFSWIKPHIKRFVGVRWPRLQPCSAPDTDPLTLLERERVGRNMTDLI